MANNENIYRYGDKDLSEFKTLILSKLAQVNTELVSLRESMNQSSESRESSWDPEDGSSSWETEYLSEQLSRLGKYKTQLQHALIRIENKTYGICRVSGKLIDKARLKAVPHTTLSVEAKSSM